MGDYRRKLRSSKGNPVTDDNNETEVIEITEIKQEEKYEDELYREDPGSPRTPPTQSIEPYFPPSPFGRKRHQAHGDRYVGFDIKKRKTSFIILIEIGLYQRVSEISHATFK